MRQSMTGFAAGSGEHDGLRWAWDLRGVNGKGLDLRLRLPDWIEGLEPLVRAATVRRITRGNVQIGLRISGAGEEAAQELNETALRHLLRAQARIEAIAEEQGLDLTRSCAADIGGLRGVMATGQGDADVTALRQVLMRAFETALDEFVEMRACEGTALAGLLAAQIDEIEALVAQATAQLEPRRQEQAQRLRAALARVLEHTDHPDESRLNQELALIAVKSDVTEELDRLAAHIAAARALLETPGAVGRKLDFLMQEFNRETNTLCSKSGFAGLTDTGLALKTVIEQMREQVQNVE